VTPPTSAAGCNVCFDCGCTTTFHGESGECAGQFGICFCRKFVRWPTINTNAFTPEFVHHDQVHRALSEANARVGELEARYDSVRGGAMTPPDAAGCEVDILESGAELHHKDLHRALAAERAKVEEALDLLNWHVELLARYRKPAAPSAERGEST
jgi:hypothetical protein